MALHRCAVCLFCIPRIAQSGCRRPAVHAISSVMHSLFLSLSTNAASLLRQQRYCCCSRRFAAAVGDSLAILRSTSGERSYMIVLSAVRRLEHQAFPHSGANSQRLHGLPDIRVQALKMRALRAGVVQCSYPCIARCSAPAQSSVSCLVRISCVRLVVIVHNNHRFH